MRRSARRARQPHALALAGEPAACTSNSMRTTPSARHAHSARAAQLVHMLTVSLNLWQEGSTSCGCTHATRLVVVVTILLRHQVRQSDDPCAQRAMPACMHDPIVQRGLCARMMASYHDQHLIQCVLIEIRTLMCISLYEQVMLSNAASASATASRHACGATSSGGRVVSGSVRSCPELPVALLPRPTHPMRMPRRLGFMVGCVVECECCL